MTNTMCARAVLSCRPNSHPFQDRTLPLDQPIKIGRSVARARPSPNNAIFDCKVLSRNHALLWYETENGKFYLQDTKSSNGTFVNNQRLSKSSEESAPRELCSGDIVQFGVDVMEVNKKLTHGCIIANVQLFLPDGKEAKASSSTIVPEKATSTPVQDIYLLNQYLKEAMLREQVLENKLAIMTKHLAGTKEFMEQNWKALIEEDRLLTRVDILERQLQASHKSMTEDKLREEVIQLLQDKEKYQNVAKDALRKAMHEKLEVTKKFKDTERNLQELESQKLSLEEMCDRNFKELKDLAEKYEQAEQNKKEITEEMNLSTQKYKDELESLNLKIKEKEDALREKKQLIIELVTKMDSKIAKSILSAHNEDVAAILPPKDAIIHVESSESNDSENRLQDLNDNKLRNEGDLENLKCLLKNSESEKKEILAKLSQLLSLFEDLKAVSNKVQVSEYVAELIGKLDVEIKQIRNFIQGEDSKKNNSYSISEDVSASDEEKSENHHIDCGDDIGTLESNSRILELLEESRQTVKSLRNEHLATERENEELRRKVEDFTFQLRTYLDEVVGLTDMNKQLTTARDKWEQEADELKKLNIEIKEKLAANEEMISLKEIEIQRLQGESQPDGAADASSVLKEAKSEKIAVPEFASQTGEQNNLPKSTSPSSQYHTPARTSDLASKVNDSSMGHLLSKTVLESKSNVDVGRPTFNGLQNRMIELEEELAVYKDRYNECSSNCTNLSRKFAELSEEHQSLLSQSKSVNLLVVIPVIILLLAILIALRPSS